METLLNENLSNPIPLRYFNYLSIHFGVLYFLNDNIEKALFFFDQALESSNVEIKALAIANINYLKS